MVNLEKWEEIEFEDVREGDIIKAVVWSDTEDFKTKSVCESKIGVHAKWGGGFWAGNLSILSGQMTPEFKRTIYRKKLKVVFTFPQNMGAVIEAEGRTFGSKKRFVWDGHDWTDGIVTFGREELKNGYKNFVVLSEGVNG